MKVHVPSFTVFLIGFNMISWMAQPLLGQDLSSIINSKPSVKDSFGPGSEQNRPSAAPPGSLLPPSGLADSLRPGPERNRPSAALPGSLLPPPGSTDSLGPGPEQNRPSAAPPGSLLPSTGGNDELSAPNNPGPPTASLDILDSAPPNPASLPRDPLEPYLWNIQMAEMSFALNNDATSYGKLITARIHLIEAACLKPILDGKGASPTELCTNVREAVLNDFRNTPAAVCARDGMDSSTCKEAHFKLPVENVKYFPTPKEKAENDFIGITDPTEDINKLSTELSTSLYNSTETSKEKLEESKIKALNLGSRILKLSCPEENYAVMPLDRNKAAKQEPVQILKMERPTPVPTRAVATPTRSPNEPPVAFNPAEFELVRLLNQQCREQLTKLRDQIPDAASLVCAEQGRFSPACLDATKAEDARYKKKAKVTPSRQTGRPADPNQKIFKSF